MTKETRPQPGSGSQKPVDEYLTVSIINSLNKCVVEMCQGNLERARQLFDEVITNSQENGGLGMREATCDQDSAHMLPAYLVSLLTYFYLRVKNFKMAKSLVKSRRFVVDTDHLVQQLKTNGVQAAGSGSSQPSKQQYSKKQQQMQNYKSIAKNFT